MKKSLSSRLVTNNNIIINDEATKFDEVLKKLETTKQQKYHLKKQRQLEYQQQQQQNQLNVSNMGYNEKQRQQQYQAHDTTVDDDRNNPTSYCSNEPSFCNSSYYQNQNHNHHPQQQRERGATVESNESSHVTDGTSDDDGCVVQAVSIEGGANNVAHSPSLRSMGIIANSNNGNSNTNEVVHSRQSFIDRRDDTAYYEQDSVQSFIESAHGHNDTNPSTCNSYSPNTNATGSSGTVPSVTPATDSVGSSRISTSVCFGEEEGRLPDAILKLDRRHDIPRPRHKNDVLVEIEVSVLLVMIFRFFDNISSLKPHHCGISQHIHTAQASTIDKRILMNRPGVRCVKDLPTTGIETTGVDCIGRVVQLTTHARAIYGVSLDDRVAGIYPFEYRCEEGGAGHGMGGGSSGGIRKVYNRYALVDANFLVTNVPRHVDGAEATTLIRLYMTAFQSIQLGILHTQMNSIDRYDLRQLKGHSILVQNGHTALGLALIELATLLGANQIFATAPTELHSLLREVGAIPLGADTFGWELFLTEKLRLVLMQEMPTPDNFETFVSIVDDTMGSIIHIQQNGRQGEDEREFAVNTEDVSCDGLYLQTLAEKARAAVSTAKFHIRLACCTQFLTYGGVWTSSKEDPYLWKEDLRFLFSLLSEGSLRPRVDERICLEDVSDAQDRIELYGKQGTIVCLPFKTSTETAFATAPVSSDAQWNRAVACKIDEYNSVPVSAYTKEDIAEASSMSKTTKYEVDRFAIDAGYVKDPMTLSDFHSLFTPRQVKRSPLSLHDSPTSQHHALTTNLKDGFATDKRSVVYSDDLFSEYRHNTSPIAGDRYVLSDNSGTTKERCYFGEVTPDAIQITDNKSTSRRERLRQKIAKDRRAKMRPNHAMVTDDVSMASSVVFKDSRDERDWRKSRRVARTKGSRIHSKTPTVKEHRPMYECVETSDEGVCDSSMSTTSSPNAVEAFHGLNISKKKVNKSGDFEARLNMYEIDVKTNDAKEDNFQRLMSKWKTIEDKGQGS